MENNPIMLRKILKKKVIQSEEFNMKESQHYNVSVSSISDLMTLHDILFISWWVIETKMF